METTTKPPIGSRYRRYLEGGDFSLEANTEAAPDEGHFYLLQDGEVLLRSDDFPAAAAGYLALCRTHWQTQLVAGTTPCRVASAWGLLGLDSADSAAAAVIQRDGAPGDQAQLVRMRNRLRAQERHTRRTAR